MISIVVPAHNEAHSIPILVRRIEKSLQHEKHEILLIDDGSTDTTHETIAALSPNHGQMRVITFPANQGQTAALQRGFWESKGDIVISMDADLQNHPEDIPKLIAKIHTGYDVVCGWREKRKDPFLTKIIPSAISNFLIRSITGQSISDQGCTMRAYKGSIVRNLNISGNMHRFIPLILALQGYRIAQVAIDHSPRLFGRSHYGWNRFFSSLYALTIILFSRRYSKPVA